MTLPDRISVALLLARPFAIDPASLRVQLNTVLGPSGMHFNQRPARHGVSLETEGLTVELRERDLPLPQARLKPALDSGLPGLLHEKWADLAAHHRAAISIDLICDPNARMNASSTGRSGTRPAGEASREMFDLVLMAAHASANALVHRSRPLAVHWGPTDRIFPTARILAMQQMLFPLPLFLHPRPAGTPSDDPKMLPELEIGGAEALIGTSLRVAPARVRFDWMMTRVLALVTHIRASQSLPADGTAFGLADGERLIVRHTPQGGLGLVLTERNGRPMLPDGEPQFGQAA